MMINAMAKNPPKSTGFGSRARAAIGPGARAEGDRTGALRAGCAGRLAGWGSCAIGRLGGGTGLAVPGSSLIVRAAPTLASSVVLDSDVPAPTSESRYGPMAISDPDATSARWTR